ncbi:MAG: methyltransferase domain-containing protein [Proteobacteria bacterium]|nr:methyltransferase domain-containing protein [Pseudomonadota bacterium]
MGQAYVHGYSPRENQRLQDQANVLVELLHADTHYQKGSRVLEAGCGVGAQTVTLARNSPTASFTSIDISTASIAEATNAVQSAGLDNVRFEKADIFNLQYAPESFDHVFVCHVLEHLSRPAQALKALKKLIKVGGSITVIEGDHDSAYFYPDSEAARLAIHCQVELQRRAGGNALIGRELYPLLRQAGFDAINVSPRMVYVDASKPGLVNGFTKDTFTAMIEGIRGAALAAELIHASTFDEGIRDLYRTTKADGVFCYTFFKAIAARK